METWYNRLGFYSNPFSIKPAAFHNEVIGNSGVVDRVVEHISKGRFVFVEGDYGNGKTLLLKRIVKEFGGRRQLAYYSCNRAEKRLGVDSILKGRYRILGKVLGLKGKRMVLLLDEAGFLVREEWKSC